MSDVYEDGAGAAADREQQRALLAALVAWNRALRRDECGAWCISGNTGTIHAWGDGKTWVLYARCRSKQHWTWVKKNLSFCTVTQDGDDEGCLRLHQLPTPDQATLVREELGIRKRIEFAPADLERRRASMSRLLLSQGRPNSMAAVPTPIPNQTPFFSPEPKETAE
jgi:hypothetical protein